MLVAHFCALAIAFTCAAHTNRPLYPYVDDTTPNQCAVVAADRKTYPVVVAGIPQGTPGNKCAGALNALEWYPFVDGVDIAGPAPCGKLAYVVQWKFAWAPSPPPTVRQRKRLLAQVEACKPAPRLVVLF